jgi:hypothetical protein
MKEGYSCSLQPASDVKAQVTAVQCTAAHAAARLQAAAAAAAQAVLQRTQPASDVKHERLRRSPCCQYSHQILCLSTNNAAAGGGLKSAKPNMQSTSNSYTSNMLPQKHAHNMEGCCTPTWYAH